MWQSKNLSHAKINNLNSWYLIINKINGYIEGSRVNKYLTLVPTNESKEALKKYEQPWNKIRDRIRSVTQTILMRNIGKSNLIWMMFYFERKR